MKQRRHRTHGQALVEFALAATLIFFLLAAAVDVGLIMLALQGLHNAAQEGAAYGSRWLVTDGQGRRVLDTTEIKNHVRFESGDTGGIGFVNLLDLNGDGVNDQNQAGVVDANITVEMLADPSMDGDPTLNVATGAAENVACTDASTATTALCYIRVTVRSVHQMLFPLAPAFSRIVPLKSAYIMPIRDSVARGSGSGSSTQIPTCTVPNMINKTANSAYALWFQANFTGSFNSTTVGNGTIKTQSLTAGTITRCTDSITVTP